MSILTIPLDLDDNRRSTLSYVDVPWDKTNSTHTMHHIELKKQDQQIPTLTSLAVPNLKRRKFAIDLGICSKALPANGWDQHKHQS
jgi:hypothetical protein